MRRKNVILNSEHTYGYDKTLRISDDTEPYFIFL